MSRGQNKTSNGIQRSATDPTSTKNPSPPTATGSNGSSMIGPTSSWSNVSFPTSSRQQHQISLSPFLPTPPVPAPPPPTAADVSSTRQSSSMRVVRGPSKSQGVILPVQRQLIPEPPIPTQSQSKHSSRSGIRSNSSRDKKTSRLKDSNGVPPRKRTLGTPYPHVRARGNPETSGDGSILAGSTNRKRSDFATPSPVEKTSIPVRKPTPAPPSSSSSSSSSVASSESYVSLQGPNTSNKLVVTNNAPQATSPDIPEPGIPRIFDRRRATAAFFSFPYMPTKEADAAPSAPVADGDRRDTDAKELLLLPDELHRVRTWSAEVESHRDDLTPLEEDVILSDGEAPVRFDNIELGHASHEGKSLDDAIKPLKMLSESELEQRKSAVGPSAPWASDNDQRWGWWGLTPMKHLPFSTLLKDLSSQRLLGNIPSPTDNLSAVGQPPSSNVQARLNITHSSVSAADHQFNQPTPISVPAQDSSPLTSKRLFSLSDLRDSKDEVSLVSPSPFSPLPSPMRQAPLSLLKPRLGAKLEMLQSPSVNYESEVSFAMAASPRPFSPVVPPRIPQSPSPQRSSSDSSTEFGRGRSPTRRSWKAASSNRSTYIRNNLPGAADQSESRGRLTTLDSTSFSRPRTLSRSPPHSETSMPIRPDTVQTVSTTELFYNPPVQRREPITQHRRARAEDVASGHMPMSLTTKSSFAIQSPIADVAITLRDKKPSNRSPSPRKRLYRAPRSVESLPASQAESVAAPITRVGITVTSPPNVAVFSLQSPVPGLQAQSPLYNHTGNYARYAVGPYLAPISLPPTTPQVASPAIDQNEAFMRVLTLVNNFTSDVSNDPHGVPRWKQDYPAVSTSISNVYKVLYEDIRSTRIDFRPWMRSWKDSMLDERMLVEAVEAERGFASEFSLDSRTLYVEDILEKLHSSPTPRQRDVKGYVQADLTRGIIACWGEIVMSALDKVRTILGDHLISLVSIHFPRDAHPGLFNFARNVIESQLDSTTDVVASKLQDLLFLEHSNPSTPTSFVRSHAAATLLSHYKGLRHQAQKAMHQRRVSGQESPQRASSVSAEVHSISPSRPSASGSSSHDNTRISSHESARQAQPRFRNTAIARLRQFSLIGSDSFEYVNDMKQALTSLSNLGFKDVDPEKLYKLFSEEDPTDDALEVMANVDSHFSAAFARFVDYTCLLIENDFIRPLGEQVTAAVLVHFDLSGPDIKERCVRWMN